MAGVLEMIWVGGEAEYFCKGVWTGKRVIARRANRHPQELTPMFFAHREAVREIAVSSTS
jgi:hypothetical protein